MQLTLDLSTHFTREHYNYGVRADGCAHGVVLTKSHVVELILDISGYRVDRSLSSLRLLEPACGKGAFLLPAVKRLIISSSRENIPISTLKEAILAYDIEPEHVAYTRQAIVELLLEFKASRDTAIELANGWVLEGDFLLANLTPRFDVVIGNPPYIRIEHLSNELQAEYRRRFSTLFDRADLYVAFIEKSLQTLAPTGIVSFICADRWTLNSYGARLRALITREFQTHAYIDLRQASPFETDVIAYPSVFSIGRERTKKPVIFVALPTASVAECVAASSAILGTNISTAEISISYYNVWFSGEAPWVLSSPEQLKTLRSLEDRFPLLEDVGQASVRIGVATGCDQVYIVNEGAEIEVDRLVPLVMRDDIHLGTIRDSRRFVINTYRQSGGVVNLEEYPLLAKYIESHRAAVAKRHVAKNGGAGWFKTIDRVYPELVSKPKLLIPDIAGCNQVVFEKGCFYPHHNLYYVISDIWDMEVLGGLLSSRVALFFVWSYAVKMRGGYLRFQAQYLRRIRVPKFESLSKNLSDAIRSAYRLRNFKKLDELSLLAYQLDKVPHFDFIDTRT